MLVGAVLWELQNGDVVGAHKISWHHEKTVPKAGESERLPVFRQTETLEPHHQIVGQERYFGIQGIGGKVSRRRTGKRKIVFQDAGDSLQPRPILVKGKDSVRSEAEVGD